MIALRFSSFIGKGLRLCVAAGLAASGAAYGEPSGSDLKTQALFESITGTPILMSDPRYKQIKALIEAGDLYGAASIAAEDDATINVRVREMFSAMSNRAESPLVPMNDFVATAMLIAAGKFQDGDARKMLYEDVLGAAINIPEGAPVPRGLSRDNTQHYDDLNRLANNYNLKEVLGAVAQTSVNELIPAESTAGLLTTRTWGMEHVVMGTNRRPVEYAFRQFLCRPLSEMKDASQPDHRVRRDVPRDPGGDPSQYVNNCVACHAGLDAMAGAFAFLDWDGARLKHGQATSDNGRFEQSNQTRTGVARKMNHNSENYPAGYRTRDDSWINYFTANQNASIGWRGFTSGTGPKEFGYMLAHSRGFSECMATRVYSLVCLKRHYNVEKMLEADYAALAAAQGRISAIADKFEESNYQFLELFKHSGASCLND